MPGDPNECPLHKRLLVFLLTGPSELPQLKFLFDLI
jgi:hypothetical protein